MNNLPKLSDLKLSEEKMRKQAKKILRQKNLEILKRPTHLFMHEKSLSKIVSKIEISFLTL